MEDVHSEIEPLCPSINITWCPIKSLYLPVEDGENCSGRIAVGELQSSSSTASGWESKSISVRFSYAFRALFSIIWNLIDKFAVAAGWELDITTVEVKNLIQYVHKQRGW